MIKYNKMNKKTVFFSILLSVLSVICTGCFNPVFYNIEKEVSLVKGSVTGSINAIVRFTGTDGEYLVTHTGSDIFYKKSGEERNSDNPVWTKGSSEGIDDLKFSYEDAGTLGMSNAYSGYFITKIAADSSNLYALAIQVLVTDVGEVEVKSNTLFTSSSISGTWTEVTAVKDDLAVGKTSIFCTNSVDSANRKAYLRGYNSTENAYVYYELSGTSASKNTSMASMTLADGKSSASETIKSAIWSKPDSSVKFFSSLASVADDNNNTYYYAIGSQIYERGVTDSIYTAKYPLMSMAATADSLIFGLGSPTSSSIGTGGIYHLPIVNGQLTGTVTDFDTNAANTLTSSYQVNVLLVEEPGKTESNSNILAAANFKSSGSSISVSYDNVGLWAYYPTRGNWNRE